MARAALEAPTAAAPARPFTGQGFAGLVAAGWMPPGDPAAAARAIEGLLDPACGAATLHWGRNYLYRAELPTAEGLRAVAVKQFPGGGLRRRLEHRVRESKAMRSWRMARALAAAGVPTPEPVLVAEARRAGGPCYFVCAHLPEVFEARFLFRALRDGRAGEEYPQIQVPRFLDALGRCVRRLHEAGVFHRDLSSGNVLVHWPREAPEGFEPVLYLIDLNRARRRRRLGLSARTRDLCRLMVFDPALQRRLLAAYWGCGEDQLGLRYRLYRLYHQGFLFKNELKRKSRGALKGLRPWLFARGTHGHIPAAPPGAPTRERVVWDALSDQPHLHAGRFEKLAARVGDLPSHLSQLIALTGALPRIRRRYRELQAELYRQPVPVDGLGVAVRPAADPRQDGKLLAAVADLGVRRWLLRLHPWQEDHDREEALARELAGRGYELTFALPQNRDLVRDHLAGGDRWSAAVTELGRRFAPYGKRFQVGQAINRSKWGVWSFREYDALVSRAAEILRRHPGVELLGPAVIDFEVHATAALVNARRAGFRFDALASLLYVDRRGAPENRQLGFDTKGKVMLLKAIADTARHVGPRSVITEVNWPLWEGPHSPAGKGVAVDEETQADYLVRFYLLALTTGLVEAVYWWQLVARGYGLAEPGPGGLRRRPSYRALAHLARRVEGAVSLGPLAGGAAVRGFVFRRAEGEELVAGWTTGGQEAAELPRGAVAAWDRDGAPLAMAPGRRVELTPSPRYFQLEVGP